MIRPLIHGVYDPVTFELLKNLGITSFSFDLRGRSFNLVTFKELTSFLSQLDSQTIFLTLQNDSSDFITSYLDLLKNYPVKVELFFRDVQSLDYLVLLKKSFYWMFDPQANWMSVLEIPNLKGVFLPLAYQKFYSSHPQFWEKIEKNNLEVFLHAHSFEEARIYQNKSEIKLSIDLTREVETSYRLIDHTHLKKLLSWEKDHEVTSLK